MQFTCVRNIEFSVWENKNICLVLFKVNQLNFLNPLSPSIRLLPGKKINFPLPSACHQENNSFLSQQNVSRSGNFAPNIGVSPLWLSFSQELLFVSWVIKLFPGALLQLGTKNSTLFSLWLRKFCVKVSPVNNFFLFCQKTEVREERAEFHMEHQLLFTKPEKEAGVLLDSSRGLERNN